MKKASVPVQREQQKVTIDWSLSLAPTQGLCLHSVKARDTGVGRLILYTQARLWGEEVGTTEQLSRRRRLKVIGRGLGHQRKVKTQKVAKVVVGKKRESGY